MPTARVAGKRTPMRTTLRGRQNRFEWRDDLSRRLRLDENQWHDGRLVGLAIETSRRGAKAAVDVALRVEIYDGEEHPSRRSPLTVTCGGVREVVTTVNCRELADMGDDHIVFARLNETAEMLDLSIYVAGGYVRIVAERFAVATRLDRRRRAPQP
jgi:hypothetical protein